MERRTYGQLSLTERIEIYRLHADGKSCRFIAKALGRSPATISRELCRNGRDGYAPERAQVRARRRHAHGRAHKLERQPELRKQVMDLLAMERSPEQIAGRLTREQGRPVISAESIYRYIYWHSYHYRTTEWHKLLPQQKRRRRRNGKRPGLPVIPARRPLAARPKGATNRTHYGHFEADLMQFSKAGRAVLVLYDRKSRYTCLKWQETKKAADVGAGLDSLLGGLPAQRRKTVTFDNGQEFRLHQALAQRYQLATFFCDPHAPWQKGGVENTIGRLRRLLPRKTDVTGWSAQALADIMHKMNNTPRKCLGFKTPAEAFFNQRVALQT